MRKATHTQSLAMIIVFSLAVIANFGGCSKDSPWDPVEDSESIADGSLSKRVKKDKTGDPSGSNDNTSANSSYSITGSTIIGSYPQYGQCTLKYTNARDGWSLGLINIPNGSTFFVEACTMTPPPGIVPPDPVTIWMRVEKDEAQNSLIFTFGPSGCHFIPSAEVWLNWTDLGTSTAILYYIDENGNYIKQQPDDVDLQGKKMKIYIDHFSRYALSRG